MQTDIQQITTRIESSIRTKKDILANQELLSAIQEVVEVLVECFRDGNTVYWCGNGGSASDAQHLAAELSGRFYFDRPSLPSEALHVNGSYITAVANDYGYENIYSRYISGCAKKGDVLVGISTSGHSQNIINAFKTAKEKGMHVIAFSGKDGGDMKALADFNLIVPSTDTPRIQECHIMIGHIICELVEATLFDK